MLALGLKKLQPIGLTFASTLIACGLIIIAFPRAASAQGEAYHWIDYQTISGSSGHFKNPVTFIGNISQGIQNVTSFWPVRPITYSQNCVTYTTYWPFPPFFPTTHTSPGWFNMQINLLNNNAARISVPQNQEGAGPVGGLPVCDTSANSTVVKEYNGKIIAINGTRPPVGDVTETTEEKYVTVTLFSSQPASTAPKGAIITIENAAGRNVAQALAQQHIMPGDEGNPPAKQAIFYSKGMYDIPFILDPGNYQVCATTVIQMCQKFTKVKFKPLTLSYGESFDWRFINVTVIADSYVSGLCLGRRTITIHPTHLILQNAQGNQIDITNTNYSTNDLTSDACNVIKVQSYVHGQFANVDPGNYTVCVSNDAGQNVCGSVTKEAGKPAAITLETTLGFLEPADQPSCMSNVRGWISVIAWPVCLLTPFIIDNILFLQNNFIVPYLSVSPLKIGS